MIFAYRRALYNILRQITKDKFSPPDVVKPKSMLLHNRGYMVLKFFESCLSPPNASDVKR